ncbi:MAG: alpha-galactosidase [candidate division KSB1 bacterium]|nr:alpha-galactosidase [candidate division KSB1 bacterium]
MIKPLSRREFSKLITLSGTSLVFSPLLNWDNRNAADNIWHIENEYFTVLFDAPNGRFAVQQRDGRLLFYQATVRANTQHGKRSIAEPAYEHRGDSHNINDRLGKGKQLVVYSRDRRREIDFETRFTLYENNRSLVVETVCRNVSSQDLVLKSIEPICAIEEQGSGLHWPGASRVLTNGPMYYNAGTMHEFGQPYQAPEPYGPIKGGKLSPDFTYPSPERVHSWWNIGIFRGYDREGLSCGFIENHTGLGQIVVSKTATGQLSLYTESVFAPEMTLQPGQTIHSDRFMIHLAANPYEALENYASAMAALNHARCHSIVNGWCEWFFTYEFITEEEVIRNAEFAAQHLKPFGLQYIQIDEGYQRYHGDWEGNDRFPHGMKWLAERIKSLGLKPGLWLAPYVIAEPTEVFQQHPEWLLKQPDGRPLRVGPWPSEDTDWARNEHPRRYGLDITHPGAADWLFHLFDTAANRWGYEMFKIDFVAWSLLSAQRYYDPAVTPAQAYRRGMEIIRRAIGPERHINDCGPGPVSVGLIDSMRIECDQNYGYAKSAWQQYFLESSSSAPAAAKRYYFHQRTWINDADHVCLNHLSIPQAQAAATLIALSGGNVISGDRLPDLDATRLEILKKVFPAYGKAARPVDLFDTDRHLVFALTIKKPFAEWTVLGVFNSSQSETIAKSLPLERLWLNPGKTYLVYDFWMERFCGEVASVLNVSVLPGHVTLLALHEKTGAPQVIGSDRHVLQGAVELEDISWDAAAGILSGTSLGPLNTSHNVAVYLPEAQYWVQGRKVLHHDFENYSVKLMDEHILRIHVKFARSERVRWQIRLDDIFK